MLSQLDVCEYSKKVLCSQSFFTVRVLMYDGKELFTWCAWAIALNKQPIDEFWLLLFLCMLQFEPVKFIFFWLLHHTMFIVFKTSLTVVAQSVSFTDFASARTMLSRNVAWVLFQLWDLAVVESLSKQDSCRSAIRLLVGACYRRLSGKVVRSVARDPEAPTLLAKPYSAPYWRWRHSAAAAHRI